MTKRSRGTLSMRFLGAQIVVVIVGLIVAAAVTALVGPPTFAEHFRMIGHDPMGQDTVHARQAYREASLITLAVTVPVALAAAAAVSWWMSRRLRRSLEGMERAAAAVADGGYDARVAPTHFGTEVDALGRAFNTMAERLERTEETRRRMLADLAHEMATPVSVLGVYLDGLDDGVVEWGSDTRGVLDQQLNRLTRLIDDLDLVSRAQEGRLEIKPEVQELGPLLEAALGAHRRAFMDKGIDLVLDMQGKKVPSGSVVLPGGAEAQPGGSPKMEVQPSPEAGARDGSMLVNVDAARLGQVFDNLLKNALRHTGAGGRVTLQVRTAVLASNEGEVTVSVIDTGEGLSPEQLDRVFERFYRGPSSRDRDGQGCGAGIGLTISKALVQAHGGTLVARSEGLGKGSIFTVTLPTAR